MTSSVYLVAITPRLLLALQTITMSLVIFLLAWQVHYAYSSFERL